MKISSISMILLIFSITLMLANSGLTIPQWSQNDTSIASASKYNPSNNYGFEINWTDDVGGIENISQGIFETNISSGGTLQNFTKCGTAPCVNNSTTGIYWINFTATQTKGAETYAYKWYANNTTDDWNNTSTLTYVIAQGATNISLYLNGSEANSSYTLRKIANFTAVVNITDLTINMTSNYTGFVQVNDTTDIFEEVNVSTPGNWWNLTAWTAGNTNYSPSSRTYFFNVSTLADGQACSANTDCTGGYCVHSICRSNPTYCGDGYCDPGEGCLNCFGDCGACPSPGGAPAEITPSADIIISSIQTDRTASVTISKDVSFKQLNITVKNSVANVRINITKTTTLPTSISQMITGNTYHYIKVDKENLDDNDINIVKIKFAVEKDWVDNNNINKSSIALYRWSGSDITGSFLRSSSIADILYVFFSQTLRPLGSITGLVVGENQWVELSTTKVSETTDEILYEAESPTLSFFAINGKVLGALPQCPSCPQASDWSDCVDGEHTRTNYKCDVTTNYECESFTETETCLEQPVGITDFLIISVIILVIIGIVVYFILKLTKI